MTTTLSRRLAAAVAVLFAAVALAFSAASPAAAAPAATGGYIRLAHLVPDNIACDMYIQLNSVNGKVLESLPGVKYGTVSDYQALPAGTYAVSMRKPGDPATAQPVLSTSVTVSSGRAYTVARIGSPDKAEIRVIPDDRTLPGGNQARVRVVQAAQRTLDVTVAGGSAIAKDVAFATATGYQGVAAGDRVLQVQPAGGKATSVRASIAAGSVYSLLVLEGANGGIKAELRTDAKRTGVVPRGGVEAGAGGTRRAADRTPLLAAGLVLLAGCGMALSARRRAPRR
jgi:Domain of unknown function (DUF4397)